jgi:hypothetical protein
MYAATVDWESEYELGPGTVADISDTVAFPQALDVA